MINTFYTYPNLIKTSNNKNEQNLFFVIGQNIFFCQNEQNYIFLSLSKTILDKK